MIACVRIALSACTERVPGPSALGAHDVSAARFVDDGLASESIEVPRQEHMARYYTESHIRVWFPDAVHWRLTQCRASSLLNMIRLVALPASSRRRSFR